jgi:phosphoglycolate phosphatase
MKIDSIIFDLDGTLWDSTKAVVKAWHNVLKSYKKIIDPVTMEQLKGIMGLQIKEIGGKLFPYLSEAEQLELMELCCEEERKVILQEGGILYPNLELTLEVL